jgi:hypothetical protein
MAENHCLRLLIISRLRSVIGTQGKLGLCLPGCSFVNESIGVSPMHLNSTVGPQVELGLLSLFQHQSKSLTTCNVPGKPLSNP